MLANGLSNLHNARRALAPVVNVVGDQATYHQKMDPPLASDAIGWARGVSAWTRTATTSGGSRLRRHQLCPHIVSARSPTCFEVARVSFFCSEVLC